MFLEDWLPQHYLVSTLKIQSKIDLFLYFMESFFFQWILSSEIVAPFQNLKSTIIFKRNCNPLRNDMKTWHSKIADVVEVATTCNDMRCLRCVMQIMASSRMNKDELNTLKVHNIPHSNPPTGFVGFIFSSTTMATASWSSVGYYEGTLQLFDAQ